MKKRANNVPAYFRLDAVPCEIEAAAAEGSTGPRRIALTAYTGARISLDDFDAPVVIDLTGLEAKSQKLPIIRDHDAGRIVGHSDKVAITARSVTVEGAVSGIGSDAAEVLASHDNGFPWQVSIGAKASSIEFVPKGRTVNVNGQQFAGPIYAVRKARLVEFSLLSLGADDRTSATIAATAANHVPGVTNMKLNDWIKAQGFDADTLSAEQTKTLQLAYDAQHRDQDAADATTTLDAVIEARKSREKREAGIARLTEQFMRDRPGNDDELEILARAAVKDGWSEEKTELEMLRATRPKTGAIGAGRKPEDLDNAVIEAAMCRVGGLRDLDRKFNERTLELSNRRFPNGLSMCEAMLLAARAKGYHALSVAGDFDGVMLAIQPDRRDIKASDGASTISLPVAFGNVANKFMVEGFGYVEPTWRFIVRTRPVRDFKQITSFRLVQSGEYRKIGASGELHHGSLGETTYTNQADTYGMILSIPRQQIINDDQSALTQLPKDLGRAGGQKLCEVVWGKFMDNSGFFKTANANYASGTSNPDTRLSIEGLTTAEKMFLDQTDDNGKPIGIPPAILLTPTALSAKGAQLMNSTELRNTNASTEYVTANPHAGKFKALSSAYLGNATMTGYSTTAWYLLADPNNVAVEEVVFLNGIEAPTVQTADAAFNTLGMQMRVFHDFGAQLQEYRGGVKMAGA